MENTKLRFSDRVENYTRYRPSYPLDAIKYIQAKFSLTSNSVVADIGSGTGIFSQLLLNAGLGVTAVEPNEAMRAESDRLLAAYPGYNSIEGSAENIPLKDASIDLITAAQAYHWFDPQPARSEFLRVLKPTGGVCLIWNKRDARSGFLQQYEALLKDNLPDYNKVKHTRFSDDDLAETLGRSLERENFAYQQSFDLEGLKGRVMSSSYCPTPEQAGYIPFMRKLEALFRAHQSMGKIEFTYKTQVYTASV